MSIRSAISSTSIRTPSTSRRSSRARWRANSSPHDDVLSLKFEEGAVVVQTARPDAFYARLTDLAASGEIGAIHEVTSPDDNLQAVFQYLVKS